MSSKKLPALHFYPGDWWKDAGVQALDHHYKGIWFEMLLLMFDSGARGYLLLNGKKYPGKVLARRLALSEQELESATTLLLDSGVCHQTEDEILFCKRMVKDEEDSQNKIKAGRQGGLAKAAGKVPSKPSSKTLALTEDESEVEIEDFKKETVRSTVPSPIVLDDFQQAAAQKALRDNGFEVKELARRLFILQGYYTRNPHKYRPETLIFDLCSPITTKLMLDEKTAKVRLKNAENGYKSTPFKNQSAGRRVVVESPPLEKQPPLTVEQRQDARDLIKKQFPEAYGKVET